MAYAAIIAAIISAAGQAETSRGLGHASQRIRQSTKFQPGQVNGPFGSIGYDPWRAAHDGFITFNPQESGFNQDIRNTMGIMNPFLLSGGLFQDPGMQAGFNAASGDMAGAFGNAQSALGQQMSPEMFGNLQASNQGLFGAGMAALGNTDQSALIDQVINSNRALTQPFQDRQFNKLQDRLFAQGRLDSSGGSRDTTNLLSEFQRQDFQNVMGGQQLGLNALQNNRGFGMAALSGAAGLENQGFNQMLGSLRQNQSAGQGRLQNAMSMFGLGRDTFGQQFGLGLQGQQGMLNQDNFLMQAILGLMNAESGRIGAMGLSNQALANLAGGQAGSNSGFFGGLSDSIMGMFG
jgi:hypothetical protein